ncbi:MAG: hypothetical protein ABIK65_06805 [Candidatus Eisenbacteria bacterium]
MKMVMIRFFGIIGVVLLSTPAGSHPSGNPVPSTPDLGPNLGLRSWGALRPGPVVDTLIVVGVVDNLGGERVSLCGKFELSGGYSPSAESEKRYRARKDSLASQWALRDSLRPPDGPRLPTFFLIGGDVHFDFEFECRPYELNSGESVADTTLIPVYRGDFEEFPGSIDVTVSFWSGSEGATYREARCLVTSPAPFRIAVP